MNVSSAIDVTRLLLHILLIQLTASNKVKIFVPHNFHHHTHTNTRYKVITQPAAAVALNNTQQPNVLGLMPIFPINPQQPNMLPIQPGQPPFQGFQPIQPQQLFPPQAQQPMFPQQPQIPQFPPQFQQLQSAQPRESNHSSSAHHSYESQYEEFTATKIPKVQNVPIKYKTIINVHESGGSVPFKELLALHLLGKQHDRNPINEFDYTLTRGMEYHPETASYHAQGEENDNSKDFYKNHEDSYNNDYELSQLRYLLNKHLGKFSNGENKYNFENNYLDRMDKNITENILAPTKSANKVS